MQFRVFQCKFPRHSYLNKLCERPQISGLLGIILNLGGEFLYAIDFRAECRLEHPIDPLLHRFEKHDHDEDHQRFSYGGGKNYSIIKIPAQAADEIDIEEQSEDSDRRINHAALDTEVKKVVAKDGLAYQNARDDHKRHEQGRKVISQADPRQRMQQKSPA